ncbi:hypothetical protein TRIUR3_10566 [Triticum urartu]|uniref:Uncharacterized protein n=1 Tax=Triticum urartu TaxID=4572 RepID=M8A9N7_TRIUA|nr:hypothetical protein TRIUR3_10566 [Triticum urartu]
MERFDDGIVQNFGPFFLVFARGPEFLETALNASDMNKVGGAGNHQPIKQELRVPRGGLRFVVARTRQREAMRKWNGMGANALGKTQPLLVILSSLLTRPLIKAAACRQRQRSKQGRARESSEERMGMPRGLSAYMVDMVWAVLAGWVSACLLVANEIARGMRAGEIGPFVVG